MIGLTSRSRARTRAEVVSQLEEAMLSGRLVPGDRLPSERQLAETYRLSRPMIREALRTLAERKLVKISPGRGAFVLKPSVAQGAGPLEMLYRRQGATARDLSEARLMLEYEAARLAAKRADLDDVTHLEESLRALEGARSVLERVQCDLAFHLRIASATHNPVIETMFVSIMRFSVELMVRSAVDPEVRARSDPFHRATFLAIKARDPATAGAAIKAHLTVASEMYGPDFEQQLDSVALRGVRSLGYADVEDFLRKVTNDETA